MKKFLGLVLTGILLFCTIFSIVGCKGEAYKNIEKYHAEIISDYEMNSDYIMANQTKGATGNSALPKDIVNVIESQEELDTAFLAFSEINFEKEMVIVYFYTSYANREKSLQGITINEGELQINIKTKNPPKGVEDGRAPTTSWIVIKMDKIEYNLIKIIM